jgi:hypothetical protein
MSEQTRVFELADGGYVQVRPNEIAPGVMLEVGWEGEGMCEVALTPEEANRIGPCLVLGEYFSDRPSS